MPKTVTLSLDDDAYQVLNEAARAENRPLSHLIRSAALSRVREHNFISDAEMAVIQADPHLLRRLHAGSRDARQRNGKFVD